MKKTHLSHYFLLFCLTLTINCLSMVQQPPKTPEEHVRLDVEGYLEAIQETPKDQPLFQQWQERYKRLLEKYENQPDNIKIINDANEQITSIHTQALQEKIQPPIFQPAPISDLEKALINLEQALDALESKLSGRARLMD